MSIRSQQKLPSSDRNATSADSDRKAAVRIRHPTYRITLESLRARLGLSGERPLHARPRRIKHVLVREGVRDTPGDNRDFRDTTETSYPSGLERRSRRRRR